MFSRLLEHFFSSPNQEHHTRIIRERNLLNLERPRPTSPALLFSILCSACYMPKCDSSSILPEISHGEFVALRRYLLSRVVELIQPVMHAEIEPTFDDAIASFILTGVGASEDEHHPRLVHWLEFCKFITRKLNLNIEPHGYDEEGKEERRRLWWAVYMIDRHTALSFNLRTSTTDRECQQLQLPCPDDVWESSEPLEEAVKACAVGRSCMVTYAVRSLDLFGVFLPLSSILGDILEYHFLRQHSSFNFNPLFIEGIRLQIEQNLQSWNRSLKQRLHALLHPDREFDETGAYEVYDEELYLPKKSSYPKVVLYGKHLYHCTHILLYGPMDFVQMYNDLEWQSSSDFVKAGEHANSCAKIAGSILATDTRLHFIYRYFGTYCLQSSFIFLLLAKKLADAADDLIYENCVTNLRLLDMFIQVANIRYQRTFARLLRQVLFKKVDSTAETGDEVDADLCNSTEGVDKDIPPDILLYRWTAGHTGLWCEEMGVPEEANKRQIRLGEASYL